VAGNPEDAPDTDCMDFLCSKGNSQLLSSFFLALGGSWKISLSPLSSSTLDRRHLVHTTFRLYTALPFKTRQLHPNHIARLVGWGTSCVALLGRLVSAGGCINWMAILCRPTRRKIHCGSHPADRYRSIHYDRTDDARFLPAWCPLGSFYNPCVLVRA